MDRHRVAIEVGVVRRANERVNLNGAALDQDDLEGLDAQPMERGRPVQEHRMTLRDIFEHVPDYGPRPLYDALGALDIGRMITVHQLPHHEGLEQLQRHSLRQPALVDLQRGSNHDHRPAGVVNALAQEVLPKTALLALEHVREALQLVVGRSGHGPAAPAVVNQRVHRLLQHPLLVADDDLRRAEVEQPLEAVVAVDDPAVEVVQVTGRKPATIELHHGPEVRRQDGQDGEDHPSRLGAGLAEGFHHAQAFDRPPCDAA